jgi:hypothetical protein
MLGDRERLPVHDLQRLEDTVTGGQPVVQRRDGGGLVLQSAVQPDDHSCSFQRQTPYAARPFRRRDEAVRDEPMTAGGP